MSNDKPRDTNRLLASLKGDGYEEFLAVYDPEYVNYDGFSTGTLLSQALGNNTLAVRVAIANQLLDDGADPTSGNPLHVLLGRARHDFEAEAPLLRRMLDQGADINQAFSKSGTPLETLAREFQFSDVDLEPFYDVILSRPEFDPLAPGMSGRPVLATLRKWSKRTALVARVEALLIERGIPPLPHPEP